MSYTILKAELTFSDDLLQRFGFEKGGRVQAAIDNAVIRYCIPYCPFETGGLATSPYALSPPGGGKVIYKGPSARYLYYGEVYGPNIPVFEDNSGEPTRFFSPKGGKKHPTGRPLKYNTDLNPQAGPFWFTRMKADHTQDIAEEARRVAGSK